jgi:uncharacterized damage-inducible protein DinB
MEQQRAPAINSATALAALTGRSTERDRFLKLYERESATTRKLLAAYPADQADLKPHDRSNSARALASTFVIEQALILKALRHEQVLGAGWPKTAETWQGLIDDFDRTRQQILDLLASSDDRIFDGSVAFFVAPKQTGEMTIADFAHFMTYDQIHHRGQLSVYLRMAGGKVPSIYGPSADEPWT